MKGLELLFQVEKQNIKSKQDALVISTHCYLLNEGFKCVGYGDEWGTDFSASELLPPNWNDDQNVYSLRYLNKDESKYVLKIMKSDMHLLINLLETEKDTANGTAVVIEDFVDNTTDFKSAFKNLEKFEEKLDKDVLLKKKMVEKAADPKGEEMEPIIVVPGSRPCPSRDIDPDWNNFRDPLRDPRNIGRSDLNPLARGGGGMLFDPFQNRGISDPNLGFGGGGIRLPRGAVPPGARFDPFGPRFPDNGSRPPAPGYMPPPDYNDMFF